MDDNEDEFPQNDSTPTYVPENPDIVAKELISEIMTFGTDYLAMPLSDCLQILRDYRAKCSRLNMYKECENISFIIQKIKTDEETKHVNEIKNLQVESTKNVEESFSQDLESATKKWETRFEQFEKEIEEMRRTLQQRHQYELDDFRKKFHQELQTKTPKFSSNLLNMRKVQDTLAKQKDFTKALQVKKGADVVQDAELQRLSITHGERYERKKGVILGKQKQELIGLETRLERDRTELEAQRDSELEIIKLRFNKNKRVLDNELGVLESRTRNLLGKHNYTGESSPSHFYANINHESLQARPFVAPQSVSTSVELTNGSSSPLIEPTLSSAALLGSSLLFNTSPKRSTSTIPKIAHSPLRSSFIPQPRTISASSSYGSEKQFRRPK